MPFRHALKVGECLQLLAHRHGLKDGKQIFDAAENAELRQKRAASVDVAPGDVVFVPDPRIRIVKLATGRSHTIVATRPAAVLRLEVHDEAGEPLADKPYELRIGDKTIEGSTTGDGIVEQPVPIHAEAATLIVYESAAKDEGRWGWHVRVAGLEAPEAHRGAWQRLMNLGYWSGGGEVPEDGNEAPEAGNASKPTPQDEFALAIRAFQHDEQLEESGRLDSATKERLVERHGI